MNIQHDIDNNEDADVATAGDSNQPKAKEKIRINELDLAIEVGGRDGPNPTRFGDWEKHGRCIDF